MRLYSHSSRLTRGADRDRHEREAGCGGRGSVRRGSKREGVALFSTGGVTCGECADGGAVRTAQVVWSCEIRPAPFASNRKHRPQRRRRRQPAGVAGESTKQAVKTIACGTPDVSGATVVTEARVHNYISHARLRMRRASGVPRALFLGVDDWFESDGAPAPQRTGVITHIL